MSGAVIPLFESCTAIRFELFVGAKEFFTALGDGFIELAKVVAIVSAHLRSFFIDPTKSTGLQMRAARFDV